FPVRFHFTSRFRPFIGASSHSLSFECCPSPSRLLSHGLALFPPATPRHSGLTPTDTFLLCIDPNEFWASSSLCIGPRRFMSIEIFQRGRSQMVHLIAGQARLS